MIESVLGMAESICADYPMLQSALALYRHVVCWVSLIHSGTPGVYSSSLGVTVSPPVTRGFRKFL